MLFFTATTLPGAHLKMHMAAFPALPKIMQRWLLLAHFAHVTWSLPGAREKSGTCLQCVCQRSILSIETQMVFQCDPMDLIIWYNTHHKPTP